MNVTGPALRRRIGVLSTSVISRWPRAGVADSGRIVSAGMRRFDRLFDLIVGGFGILYALQTADSLVAGLPSLSNPLGVAIIVLVCIGVAAGVGPLVAPAHAARVFLVGAAVYGVALLLWAHTVTPPVPVNPMPWLIAVWPVGAAYLARGSRTLFVPIVIATAVSAVASVALRFRGDVAAPDVAVDSLFMTGLALVLVLLLGTVRHRVVAAALAQQCSVDSFAAAQLEEATEQERKRTDALLHDAVLTTFLSAASADDDDAEELASRMAANSLRVLLHVNAVGRSEDAVPFGQIVADHRDQLGAWLSRFDHDLAAVEVVMLPENVARALVDMLAHSLANSVQHAEGATRRTVRAHQLGSDGIRIVIEDDGCGFDPEALGQRGSGGGSESSRALRALEGRVDIDTAAETGTRIVLSWGSVAIVGTELLVEQEDRARP
ncbi:signal transduction histidine kinase [Frondihabitans sp. PhB188]|nr:signal transduction histidine kinase [Frondihabitans sp. PhB188]